MSRAVLTVVTLFVAASGSSLAQEESLFKKGDIEVVQRTQRFQDDPGDDFDYNMLLFDRIHFGMNFLKPSKKEWQGNPEKDLSRLAAAYWHRRSPMGVVLEKFNWFHGPDNTYAADARLSVSLAGLGCAPFASLPVGMLSATWSEPAIGGVGLAVGTLASYARPLQYLDIFEPNATIIELSLPAEKKKAPYFRYVRDAMDRGARVRIVPGAPRQSLADVKKAPDAFYHVLVIEPYKRGIKVLHEDLLTKEALALCMSKLVPDGILCFHTSNRYYDLVPIIADNAASLKLFERARARCHTR